MNRALLAARLIDLDAGDSTLRRMRRALVPGFRFKEGKLFVFTDDYALSIDGWTELTAVRREANKRAWQPFVPQFRLLKPRADGPADETNADLDSKEVENPAAPEHRTLKWHNCRAPETAGE